MKKGIPIGVEDFEKIINNNGYYVDKTKMIEDLIVDISKLSYSRVLDALVKL